MVWYGYGMPCLALVWYGMVWYPWHGMERYDMVAFIGHAMVWYDMVSLAWYGMTPFITFIS
jgi:hypothetical protein